MKQSGQILLGVSGGIAAYKAAELARLLVKNGWSVIPSMTRTATEFMGTLTLASITEHEVHIDVGDHSPMDHIRTVRSSDLLLVAPATAHTIAKFAHGQADDFLSAAYLAHKGPSLICPSMNTAMWHHPATQRNLSMLRDDGVLICPPDSGELACGEWGDGRLAEAETILEYVAYSLSPKHPTLQGKKVVVSAGPTCEDLDPVRFLSNRSTGLMGFAIARALWCAGAEVVLVSGPTHLRVPAGVQMVKVRSAAEMAEAVHGHRNGAASVIMNAAVADYRPAYHPHKLKKDSFNGVLALNRTEDILATLGKDKNGCLLIGFAAETEDGIVNGRKKLIHKNCDGVVVNRVGIAGQGFESDTNQGTLIWRDGREIPLPMASKQDFANLLVTEIGDFMHDLAGIPNRDMAQ